MPEFKDIIKELRKNKNMSQKQMGLVLGISERAYQHYEYGTRFPDFQGLQKLADYFDVSVDYLMGRKNYWQDSEGNIKVKVPADIFNLDTDELKKKLNEK